MENADGRLDGFNETAEAAIGQVTSQFCTGRKAERRTKYADDWGRKCNRNQWNTDIDSITRIE